MLGSADLDGTLVDARLVDGMVRVATSARPTGLPLVQPSGGGVVAEQEALEANQAALEQADADQLLPGVVRRDADGDVLEQGALLECGDVARPADPAGAATLSLLALRLDGDEPLAPVDAQGLVADGGELYATADQVVLTTTPGRRALGLGRGARLPGAR